MSFWARMDGTVPQQATLPVYLVDSEEYYIIFDAGDGMYKLDSYITSDKPIYLFLSHFHLEHIFGFHILSKFRFKQGINVYGQKGTRSILNQFIQHPFTVPLSDLATIIKINELSGRFQQTSLRCHL